MRNIITIIVERIYYKGELVAALSPLCNTIPLEEFKEKLITLNNKEESQ